MDMVNGTKTVDLGGEPNVWVNARDKWCAIMSKTPVKGTFALGHQDIDWLTECIEEFVATLRLSSAMQLRGDEWAFVLALYDPMRSLSWRPTASNEMYVLLEWSGGADGSDGFLQLVSRSEIEHWPEKLRGLKASLA